MILFSIKSILAFCFSFFILTAQYQDRYLFDYLTEIVGPIGANVQTSVANSAQEGISQVKDYTKKLFINSEPKMAQDQENKVKKIKDAIKTKASSSVKATQDYLDDLKDDERHHLSEIIEKN